MSINSAFRYSRVELEPISHSWAQPISLEAPLDQDSKIYGCWYLLGIWGVFNGTGDMCPFVLRVSGDIDFGSGYNGSQRVYRSNFREKILRNGDLVTLYTESREEITYRVKSVTPFK